MPQLSLHSPVGDLAIAEDAGSIVALDWGWGAEQDETPLLGAARHQLHDYFDGKLTLFDLPLAPEGSPFQLSVWALMQEIPCGQTRTYGDLAGDLKTSPRAVGLACGANPIPIIIPCHRVVSAHANTHAKTLDDSHTSPGGYSGEGGVETKISLLRLEGVPGYGPDLFA